MKTAILHDYSSMRHGDLIRIGGHTYVYDDCYSFHYDYDDGVSTIASSIGLVDEDNALYVTVEVDEFGFIESVEGRGMNDDGSYYDEDLPFNAGDMLIIRA